MLCVSLLLALPRTRALADISPLRVAGARSHATGRAPPSRAAARDTGGYARRSTPPPFRSSPNGRGASPPRGTKHDWFQPLKPISTFKGVLRAVASVACATAGLLYPCGNVRARREHARTSLSMQSGLTHAAALTGRLRHALPLSSCRAVACPCRGQEGEHNGEGKPDSAGPTKQQPGQPQQLETRSTTTALWR